MKDRELILPIESKPIHYTHTEEYTGSVCVCVCVCAVTGVHTCGCVCTHVCEGITPLSSISFSVVVYSEQV